MIEEEWGTGVLLELYAPSVAGDPEVAAWWAGYQRISASPKMAKAAARMAAEVDIREVLPAIRVPTMVLHRDQDSLWPVEGARYISEQIEGAQLVVCEGIDHFPFTGDTESLLGEIEAFLTGSRHVPEPERQLLTVLFTDIVDSTERAIRDGRPPLARAARGARRDRPRPPRALPRHRGEGDRRRLPGDLRRAGARDRVRPRDRRRGPPARDRGEGRPPHRRVRDPRRRHRRHERQHRRSGQRSRRARRGAGLEHGQGPGRRRPTSSSNRAARTRSRACRASGASSR